MRLYKIDVEGGDFKNYSNYGCYHGTGITGGIQYRDCNFEEGTNNWAIGGYADTENHSYRNHVKNCYRGIRCGADGTSIGDTVENCQDIHIEARNGMIKNYTIASGDNTAAGAIAINNAGNGAKLIGYGTISNDNGRFGKGIYAPLQTKLIENGVFGTYSAAAIDTKTSTFKRDNYNDAGATI